MAGQGMEGREILRFIGIASVAGAFPGFSKWAFACGQSHQGHEVGVLRARAGYQLMFFSPEQYLMIARLAVMIIPGAREAGVDEFIDFMVANRVPVSTRRDVKSTQDAIEMGIEAQNKWSAGLAWMNARSKSQFEHEFMELSEVQRTALLEELAYKAKFKPGTESGR